MNEGHPADGNEGLFSSLFKKITGKVKKDDDVTEEEIMDMVNEGHEQGVLKENEAEMIGNIFEFGEKHASDVMTHRKSIVGIEADTTVEEAFEFIMGENYSRYPVYNGDIDNITGILHIRDLLKIYVDKDNQGRKLKDVEDTMLFKPYCIPETRNISPLFRQMQSEKIHMAIVVDEYGQTAGIVTMEDILEEIVGDILDEYDEDEITIRAQKDNSLIVDRLAYLEDVEEELEADFGDTEFETLNGYLTNILGHIPTDKDIDTTIKAIGYCFTILSIGNKTIGKVRVERDK